MIPQTRSSTHSYLRKLVYSGINKQLDEYVSWDLTGEAEAVDAFSLT